MTIGKKDLLLYAVTDQTWTGTLSLYEQVQQAIEGGITCLQLREKNMSEDKFLQEAKEIGALCKEKQITFIVNDDVEVAVKTGAEGLDKTEVAQLRDIILSKMETEAKNISIVEVK